MPQSMHAKVLDFLRKDLAGERITGENIFTTVREAVEVFQQRHPDSL